MPDYHASKPSNICFLLSPPLAPRTPHGSTQATLWGHAWSAVLAAARWYMVTVSKPSPPSAPRTPPSKRTPHNTHPCSTQAAMGLCLCSAGFWLAVTLRTVHSTRGSPPSAPRTPPPWRSRKRRLRAGNACARVAASAGECSRQQGLCHDQTDSSENKRKQQRRRPCCRVRAAQRAGCTERYTARRLHSALHSMLHSMMHSKMHGVLHSVLRTKVAQHGALRVWVVQDVVRVDVACNVC